MPLSFRDDHPRKLSVAYRAFWWPFSVSSPCRRLACTQTVIFFGIQVDDLRIPGDTPPTQSLAADCLDLPCIIVIVAIA